jgi:sugar (pentulose or hexulose) kinase
MEDYNAQELIAGGKAIMGMELGSTRIKAVLIGPDSRPLATGSFAWENSLVDGIWTYSLDEVWEGIASCYAGLKEDVRRNHRVELASFAMGGFSAMMHGYLVFDAGGKLLTPFRTWRNNRTEGAAQELTRILAYPIPQRWSIAHLYQAILDRESHVPDIAFMTTLSGYVHWKLSGQKTLGIGDASGMFPIDTAALDFDRRRMALFNERAGTKGFKARLEDIFPSVLPAGSSAGTLSEEGARLLDPSGGLKDGIALCPPEGDAGTGMAATNSVRVRTGNVSAGTSVFAMLVMDKEPASVHEEIDLVTTPDGTLVGMAHSNNCSSDLDAWIYLFGQAAEALGAEFTLTKLYETLLPLALDADPDCGAMLSYGYVSGEHLTGFSEGRPLFVRRPDTPFTLGNFIRTHLFSSLCALRAGLDVLTELEGVRVDEIRGHGGFFKTTAVGQRIMAAATNTPVSLIASAGEGGAWGMALLAAFALRADTRLSLPDFLDRALAGSIGAAMIPEPADVAGFDAFYARYRAGLAIERSAVDALL